MKGLKADGSCKEVYEVGSGRCGGVLRACMTSVRSAMRLEAATGVGMAAEKAV